MGRVIEVTTTQGSKRLDLEAADHLEISVGGVTYRVEAPHIEEMLKAYMNGSYAAQIQQQSLERIRAADRRAQS
jgi:hypothetical protein